jgi:hypothetical protein
LGELSDVLSGLFSVLVGVGEEQILARVMTLALLVPVRVRFSD